MKSITTSDPEFLTELHKIQVNLLIAFADLCNRYKLQWWIDFGTLLGAIRHEGKFIPWDDDLDVSMPREDFQKLLTVAHELPDSIFFQTAESDPFYDDYMVEAKLRDRNSTFIEYPDGKHHQGVFIDIFPYDKTFRDKSLRKKHQRLYKTQIVGFRQNVITSMPLWKDPRPLRKWLLSLKYRFISIEKCEQKILDLYKKDRNWVWRPTLASKMDDSPVEDADLFPLKESIFEGVAVFVPANCNTHLTSLYGNWKQLPPVEQQRPAHCHSADLCKPWKQE